MVGLGFAIAAPNCIIHSFPAHFSLKSCNTHELKTHHRDYTHRRTHIQTLMIGATVYTSSNINTPRSAPQTPHPNPGTHTAK